MSMIDKTKLYREQAGVVSIMVVTMLIIIVSLVVLGLAQISRRETRLSLDTQLSAQAYYAAESGFNEASQAINQMLAAGTTDIPAKDDCSDSNNYENLKIANSKLNSDGTVRFTCVLIDPTPKELRGSVGTDSSVFYLKTNTGNFQTVTIKWTAAKGVDGDAADCPNSGQPTSSNWGVGGTCPFAMLRVDLANVGFPPTFSRDDLINNTTSGFFRPDEGTGTNAAYQQKGFMNNAHCSDGICTAKIEGLSSSNEYYLRLSALYQKADVIITATTDAGGADAEFVDSQVRIDATGKAQDVLKRLVVAKPLTGGSSSGIPGGAIVSGDSICKRFTVGAGTFSDTTGCSTW